MTEAETRALIADLKHLAADAASEPVGSAAHMYHCAKLGALAASNVHIILPALAQSLKGKDT